MIAWEDRPYPPRPFVRYRMDTEHHLRLGRIAPLQGRAAVLSIIIPTLDGERGGYLPRLLAQLRQQTYQDWEALLVLGDSRQGRAINAAADLAAGAYLMTLDDDTQLNEVEAVERAVVAIRRDPAIGMAGGINVIPQDASPFVARIMREIPRRATAPVVGVTDSDLAEHPFLVLPKDVFLKVGGEHEGLPRGLDPYLRETVREAGYRVVVVPGADYSHLPPPTFRKLLRQFFRNGAAAAYVNRHYPQWAIETPADHGAFRARLPFPVRLLRFPLRLCVALLTGKPVWFFCQTAYAAGFIRQWMAPKEYAENTGPSV